LASQPTGYASIISSAGYAAIAEQAISFALIAFRPATDCFFLSAEFQMPLAGLAAAIFNSFQLAFSYATLFMSYA
jgi:hypothetical protein